MRFSLLCRFGLLALFVSGSLICADRVRAASASSNVSVSVAIENPTISSSSDEPPDSDPPPRGGRREESILLRIFMYKTFLATKPKVAPPKRVFHAAPRTVTSDVPSTSEAVPVISETVQKQVKSHPFIAQKQVPLITTRLSEGRSAPTLCEEVVCTTFNDEQPMPHEISAFEWLAVLLWLLFILLLILLCVRIIYRYVTRDEQEDAGRVQLPAEDAAIVIPTQGRTARHTLAHTTLTTLVVLCMVWLLFSAWEGTRAAETGMNVSVTVIANELGFSCGTPVSLGTIDGTGDTGEYHEDRATECTVTTTNAGGYTLKWQVLTGSGGANTGSLIGTGDGVIPKLSATSSAPTTWAVTTSESVWGGRLSSMSTTVNTGVWGIDALSELWAGIGTGATTLAVRTSQTGIAGDTEMIGFRAEVGNAAFLADDTYTTVVTFSVVTP